MVGALCCLALGGLMACSGGKAPATDDSDGLPGDSTLDPGETDEHADDTGPSGDDTGPDDSQSADDTGGTTDPCAVLVAHAAASRWGGRIPLEVSLDGSASCGPAAIASWDWDIDGEHLTGEAPSWTGLVSGDVSVVLTVTDEAGDTDTDTLTIAVTPGVCPIVEDDLELGVVEDAELVEASGLVVSRRDGDVLWTHNDSGDTPRLFALLRDGTPLGTWSLDVPLGDWEDLAWATDDDSGEPLLFIGNTGNNSGALDKLEVYVLDEPEVDLGAEPEDHAVDSFRTLTLRLPEALNIDSLLVDPVTGDLLLFSDAESGRTVILRKPAPHLDGDDVTLEEVAELAFGEGVLDGDTLVTGADISPLGDRVVLRTRDEAWLWPRDGEATVADTLAAEPCAVPLPVQPLGESVAFDIVDGGLLTISEGDAQPVIRVPFSEEAECIDTLEAIITASPPGGPLPLTVDFDASASCAPEGLADAEWDIDGEVTDGLTATGAWLASGSYPVTLTIWDETGASASASTTIEVEPGDCPTDDDYEIIGTVTDEDLIEISGVVVSNIDPDVLWVHNDAGDEPRLFAISREGDTLGTWSLDVDRGDIEDITSGFASDGTPELWVGDIGDNKLERTSIKLHRIDEPEIPAGDPEDHEIDAADIDTLTLTYPDEPRNCETLMLDPVTGDLYLVTKDYDGMSDVYRKAAPHTDGEEVVLEHVAALEFGGADLPGGTPSTAGSFSPDGAWILVRTYANVAYIWPRDRSGTVDDAFAGDACPISLPSEPQGEAICFDTDGDALISISEHPEQPIYRTALTR